MREWLNRPEKTAYLFILPSMLILLVFTIIPVISAVGISLFNMNMFFKDTAFVGLANDKKAFADPWVWNSFGNTLKFVLMEVPLFPFLWMVISSLKAEP